MKIKKGKKKGKGTHFYGMTKLAKGAKTAWLSQENVHGWSLGLALADRTIWLRNLRFASRAEVEKALEKNKVVFMPLKSSKK